VRILAVDIAVPDPAATAGWYRDVLGLDTDGLSVRIGSSTLRLVPGPAGTGHHHLAFAVPADGIRDGLSWLRDRVPSMPVDGSEIVTGSPSWDSESVYFRGPDGAILELIARHRLPDRPAGAPGAFGPASLLAVSEVGVPVPDPAAAVAALGRTLGAAPFGQPGPGFAPVGDDTGLLIVVAEDRVWFPTAQDRPATGPLAVTVRAPDGRAAAVELAPGRRVTAA